MQSISPVTPAQLLAPGQEPLMKIEIYVDTAWVNLCDLDGKNYVEGVNISLGGAGMTPSPVGGTCDVALSNEDSIFHPQHPTSGYEDYLKTGRKIRASIGAKYNDTDYYWQRVIGYIDEPRFEALAQKVGISGADYMKLLEDTELRSPDNYWGTSATFDSIASDGLVGSEIYAEGDAMEIGEGEADNVDNWVAVDCNFASFADVGGGSDFVGRLTGAGASAHVKNLNVGSAIADKEYKVKFKYRGVGEVGMSEIRVEIHQASGLCRSMIYPVFDAWLDEMNFYFTALDTGAIEMRIYCDSGISDLRLDQFSIWEFVSYWERYYPLPEACKGPFYVTLDDVPCWQGEEDEGWYYAEDAEPGPDPPAHPARIVFFDINKVVANGENNLKVYYFTAETPENAVARLLFKAGLYASEAAALAAMEYTATGITIDKIWFEAGSTCLNAIKKICERCDYRFHFKYNGIPVFKPKPAPETTAFTFTDQKHISGFSNYQDRGEIKNRIVIKGMKQAEPVNKEETMPPELKGEAHDQTSIDKYGERTLTIKNHLFQEQAPIDAMVATLLADRKDPKWYSDVEVPFNPVPLELGDKMGWKERLSPVLEIAQEGIIRDIKIDGFNTTYKCET
ncbi:hypothetical protein ES702_07518 [subsurface metagenome]